jgi:predicted metal-dependent enzyme (double-stranded beta helix superfamily)
MPLEAYADTVRAHVARHPSPATLDALLPLAEALSDLTAATGVAPREVPYARYLLHADPEGRFNVQLDVFSRGYTGGVHAHGTWGIFTVLRGGLWVDDFEAREDGVHMTRRTWAGVGAVQAFCPPRSDWHRVSTREGGPQTVSIHVYGPGFNLDDGVALGADGRPRSYRRGPLGDLSVLEGFLLPAGA